MFISWKYESYDKVVSSSTSKCLETHLILSYFLPSCSPVVMSPTFLYSSCIIHPGFTVTVPAERAPILNPHSYLLPMLYPALDISHSPDFLAYSPFLMSSDCNLQTFRFWYYPTLPTIPPPLLSCPDRVYTMTLYYFLVDFK